MSESILDRLGERIAVEPAIIDIESLFSDLKDAQAEIATLNDIIRWFNTARSKMQYSDADGVDQWGNILVARN